MPTGRNKDVSRRGFRHLHKPELDASRRPAAGHAQPVRDTPGKAVSAGQASLQSRADRTDAAQESFLPERVARSLPTQHQWPAMAIMGGHFLVETLQSPMPAVARGQVRRQCAWLLQLHGGNVRDLECDSGQALAGRAQYHACYDDSCVSSFRFRFSPCLTSSI